MKLAETAAVSKAKQARTVGDVQGEQGWTNDTVLILALEFLYEQNLMPLFVKKLEAIVANERDES